MRVTACVASSVACMVLSAASALAQVGTWPGGEAMSTVRDATQYGYETLAKGLFELGQLVVYGADERVLFVQRRAYEGLGTPRPSTREQLHSLWEQWGNEEGVYELSGGKVAYRFPGAGDPWGGLHITLLGTDGQSTLCVYRNTGLSHDGRVVVYDLRTNGVVAELDEKGIAGPLARQLESWYCIVVGPTDGFVYAEPTTGTDILVLDPQTAVLESTKWQASTFTFDPDGNRYSGWLGRGFARGDGDPVPVQLGGAAFPGAREGEEFQPDPFTQSLLYDVATRRLLVGGCIRDGHGETVGYTVFEVDPVDGKVYPVIEQRGQVGLAGFAVSPKGTIFLSVDDGLWGSDDGRDPLSGQIIRLQRR